MKRCRQCGDLQPLSEYWINRRYADGRESTCRSCRRMARKGCVQPDPVLTKDWPIKANGLYKMYWELDD